MMKLTLVLAVSLLFAAASCGSGESDVIGDVPGNDAASVDSARADTQNGDSARADARSADSATADMPVADSAIGDAPAGDLAPMDATARDSAPTDMGAADSPLADASADSITADSPLADASAADSATADSRTVDAATTDTWTADAVGVDGPDSADGSELDGAPADTTADTGPHLVSVTLAGNGSGTVTSNPAGINCGPTCAASFDYGQNVTLTASPSTHSTFTGWSGSGCTGTAPCILSVTAASIVTATFTLVQHTVTASKDGNGAGTVTSNPAGINCGPTCAANFDYGQDVTLTASPSTGSTFTGWSGSGCMGTTPCTVTVTAASSVNATFTLLQRSLSANKAGAGTGTVTSNPAGIDCGPTCSATFNHGTIVSMFATSTTSAFMGWSGSCVGMGACSVTMIASRSVTATFVPPLSCTTVTTASICTNGTMPQINLGQITSTACHDQCQISMRQAGMTTGCWILAGDGNCYCRSGSLSGGGIRWGGFCN